MNWNRPCRSLQKKHNQARVRVLQALLNQEDFEQGIPYERLKQEAGTTMAVLHGLEGKGNRVRDGGKAVPQSGHAGR